MKLEQNGFFVRSPPNCGGCCCSLKVATKGLLLTRDKSVKELKIFNKNLIPFPKERKWVSRHPNAHSCALGSTAHLRRELT